MPVTDQFGIVQELRKLEKYVRLLPSMRRMNSCSRKEQELLVALRDATADARKLANDSATSEDAAIKLASVLQAVESLEAFRTTLLEASQYDLVDPADVAVLSALADGVIDYIKR